MSEKTTAPQQSSNRIYPLESVLRAVRSMAGEITEYADGSTEQGREIRALGAAIAITLDGYEQEEAAEDARAQRRAATAWQLLEEAERWLASNPAPAASGKVVA